MMVRTCKPFLTGLALVTLSAFALADNHSDPDWTPLASDVLAGGCAGCHGTDGKLSGLIPSINGRPADVLEAQLQSFRSGSRQGTVMNRIVGGYSDAELAQIAQHFSAIEN